MPSPPGPRRSDQQHPHGQLARAGPALLMRATAMYWKAIRSRNSGANVTPRHTGCEDSGPADLGLVLEQTVVPLQAFHREPVPAEHPLERAPREDPEVRAIADARVRVRPAVEDEPQQHGEEPHVRHAHDDAATGPEKREHARQDSIRVGKVLEDIGKDDVVELLGLERKGGPHRRRRVRRCPGALPRCWPRPYPARCRRRVRRRPP